MKQFKLARVDVLKLDVEGAEKAIFENSKEWIASVAVIYAELHERLIPGTCRAFFRATEGFEDHPTQGEKVCTINRKLVARPLKSILTKGLSICCLAPLVMSISATRRKRID